MHFCREAMTTAALREEGLKGLCGEDRAVAELLAELAQQGTLDVHLARLERHREPREEGQTEDEEEDECDDCSMRIRRTIIGQEPPRHIRRTQQLLSWTGLDGQPSRGMRPLSLDEGLSQVLQVCCCELACPDRSCSATNDGLAPCLHACPQLLGAGLVMCMQPSPA